jgi:hypothetical protein
MMLRACRAALVASFGILPATDRWQRRAYVAARPALAGFWLGMPGTAAVVAVRRIGRGAGGTYRRPAAPVDPQ